MNTRKLSDGMGRAVASRTILREGEDWLDVAIRVAHGNAALTDNSDFANLRDHIAAGNILMSGRHLQHGDTHQPTRNMEVFSNCSTAAASFIKFYLLLNGSGVGRVYDDDMMVVNWDNAPNIKCVLDGNHPDFAHDWMESLRDGRRKYHGCIWHTVKDSREGWAHALELWETMTWEGYNKHKTVVFDFSKVRCKGSPIGGMQNRPASGPAPLMLAFLQVASLKGLGWEPWKQAMWVDHYIADCVLVGGVRRSARIAGKWWKDSGIFEFIDIKRPPELEELHTITEVAAYRKNHPFLSGFLWTANNSICVDEEFWDLVKKRDQSTWSRHACKVFDLVTKRAYADGTGEPGFVTVSSLTTNEDGLEHLDDGSWFGSTKFQPQQYATQAYLKDLTQKFKKKRHKFFVNPCFAGDTLVPVRGQGLVRIKDLDGLEVEVKNGNGDWVTTKFRKTGENQPLLSVELSDGSIYRVTPEHAFMQNGRRVKARELEEGGIVDSHELIQEHGSFHNPEWAWLQAWYMCDGTEASQIIRLYEDKRKYTPQFEAMGFSTAPGNSDRQEWVTVSGLRDRVEVDKGLIPHTIRIGDLETKLAFIRGVLESDGHVGKTDKGFIMQVSSIRRSFLEDLQQLLYSVGAYSKISLMHPARLQDFPEGKQYECKDCWRLTVTNPAKVIEYLWPERLTRGPYNLGPKHVFVVSVTDNSESEDTYCCTIGTTGSFQLGRITTGNCGEIVLSILGGFCVIADVVPFHCETLEEAEDAFRAATRALIRVNTMPSVYGAEVKRTNRIGVGITGLHEFAYKFFKLGFREILSDGAQSQAFWETLQRFSQAVRDEAETYSKQLGVATPHTCTTIKPAGTTSKLFGLTEGAHLPAIGFYMRWVQFSNSDPIIDKYAAAGYPTRKLTGMYAGKTIVGFPTKPTICDLIPEDEIVYAGDATPDEQYQYLRLLEKYWLGPWGNQISYTLKYKPEDTPYEVFKDSVLRNQPTVKCCSVMPQEEGQSYEYLPEETITAEEYEVFMSCITPIAEGEDVDREHIECAGGACPIDFREDSGRVQPAVPD